MSRTIALMFFVAICTIAVAANAQTFSKYGKTFPVGANPSSVVAEDMNDDGFPEIFSANTGRLTNPDEERPANDEVSFLVAQGALNYATQPPLRAGFGPMALVVANFDALKAPDLLVASFHTESGPHLTLFRNLGENRFETAGQFTVATQFLTYCRTLDGDNKPIYTKPGITSAVVLDANHDGFRDAIAAAWASDVLLYFPGSATGYLGESKIIPAAGGPRDIRAGDFDGDGEPDLAVSLYISGEVGLWKGSAAGNYASVTRIPVRGPLPHKVRIADMNGDGKPDLVVSHCFTSDSIEVYYGDGDFRFPVSQEIMLGKDPRVLEDEIRDIVVDDFNRDGAPDIAAACHTSQQVSVFINRPGAGSVSRSFAREDYSFAKEGRPRALCVADLNQDGGKDLVVALWGSNQVAFLLGAAPPPTPKQPSVAPAKPAPHKSR